MIAETHFAAPEEVMALLDGELSTERAASVSAHVAECAECREFVEILRNGSMTVANWTVPVLLPNGEFEKRLAEAAPQVPSRGRLPELNKWSAFLGRSWMSIAAVTAIVLAVAVTSSRRMATPTNMPVDMARTDRGGAGGGFNRLDQFARGFGPQKSATVQGEPASKVSENLPESVGQRALEENGLVSPEDRFSGTDDLQTPLIARTVTVSIMVKDFSFSRTALDAILARHHGYAASLNASTQQNAARSLQASLRIPAGELNAVIAELKSLGHVENETQAGEEVTQQHADLVARLKNSRETEQRLQAILLQRTGKISDVLAVEQEIARVRGEIEQMEAEQKALEHRVDFASIELSLAEEYKAQIGLASPSIATRIHNATVAGYRSAIESVVGIIIFFTEFGPSAMIWLAFLAPLAWFLRRRWRLATSLAS
jgi:predicted transcriptional regulator